MVEVPQPPITASWHKSRMSGVQECVQIMHAHSHVWVRDSKNPEGPVLQFASTVWMAFLGGVRHGGFTRIGLPA